MSTTLLIAGLLLLNCYTAFGQVDPNNAKAENYFYSNTVPEATAKFTTACRGAGGSIEYMVLPEKGAQNETLQAAVCSIGDPQNRAVIFTISGTHGIEGYAGSMAQISMLRGPPTMFLKSVRMVHLHMVNPYGASHILKENEQNADQYKNYGGFYALGYDNPIVQKMMDGIDLKNLANETVRNQAIAFFGNLTGEYGADKVNLALKTGQGKRPEGIAYFGPSKSWSSKTIDSVLDKYVQKADRVLLIDWHTAVGPYGTWACIPSDPDSEKAFKRWAPNALVVENDVVTPTGGSVPYSNVKTVTGAKQFVSIVWEAGTYPADMEISIMFILRLHCRFYNTPSHPMCAYVISRIQEFFYPQKEDWKVQTYNGINDVLPKVISGFAADAMGGTPLNTGTASVWISSYSCILFGLLLHFLLQEK